MLCHFYHTCVDIPEDQVSALTVLVETARPIQRRTFLRHVYSADMAGVETGLGYVRRPQHGLTMARDWHVAYRKGRFLGQRCYFFVHSAIEYLFLAHCTTKE